MFLISHASRNSNNDNNIQKYRIKKNTINYSRLSNVIISYRSLLYNIYKLIILVISYTSYIHFLFLSIEGEAKYYMVRDNTIATIAYAMAICGITMAGLFLMSGYYTLTIESDEDPPVCPDVDTTPPPCIPIPSHDNTYQSSAYAQPPTYEEGYLLSDGCCYYSHPEADALITKLLAFERDYINPNFAFERTVNPPYFPKKYFKGSDSYEYGEAFLRSFTDFNPYLVDMETPLENNTDLQYLYVLRSETERIKGETNNTMERVIYDRYLSYMTLILELAEVDALYLIYGLRTEDSGIIDNPINTLQKLFRHTDLFSIFDRERVFLNENRYDNKTATFVLNVKAKLERFHAHGIRSMNAQKVHAHRVLTNTHVMSYGKNIDYHHWGSPDNANLFGYRYTYDYSNLYSPTICDFMFRGASLPPIPPVNITPYSDIYNLCYSVHSFYKSMQTTIRNWWEAEYTIAAETLRPSHDEHLTGIPDGQAIYNAFRKFHLGNVAKTDAQFFTELELDEEAPDHWSNDPRIFPNSRLSWEHEIPNTYRVRAEIGGVSDSAIHQCSNDRKAIEEPYMRNLTAIQRLTSPKMGFPSRVVKSYQALYRTDAGSHAVDSGMSSFETLNWMSPYFYKIQGEYSCLGYNGGLSFKEGPFQVADLAYYMYPGHALREGVDMEIDCKFGSNPLPGRYAFTQGYARYAVDVCYESGCFDNSDFQLIGHGHSLAELKLLAHFDICMNNHASGITPCTASDLWDAYENYGVRNNYHDRVLGRILNTPGYYLSAYHGYKRIHELRTSFMTSLNAIANPVRPHSGIATFHAALLRFGMTDFDNELQPMFNTLLKFYNNETITKADYAWDLIPWQLFSTKPATVGYGRNPSNPQCRTGPDRKTGARIYTSEYIKP